MSDYQIAFNNTSKTVTIQPLNDALPVGSINIGTFQHDDEDDLLGSDVSHVLYHHVRDALYKRSRENPAVAGFWPDNITDMAGITITVDTTANPVPINSVAPAVTGTLQVGDVLTTTNGTWSASPTFARQWKWSADNDGPWTNISGATDTTYTLVEGDLTRFIKCDVTATNANGSNVQASNVVGPVTPGGS